MISINLGRLIRSLRRLGIDSSRVTVYLDDDVLEARSHRPPAYYGMAEEEDEPPDDEDNDGEDD